MKLYVLIHSASGQIQSSEAFKNQQDAIEKLKDEYEGYLLEGDYVASDELFDTHAKVEYIDGTYDRLDIVEVNVEI